MGYSGKLGYILLCVNAKDMQEKGLLSAEEVSTIQKNVKQAADYFIDLENQSDFGIPYVGHATMQTFGRLLTMKLATV